MRFHAISLSSLLDWALSLEDELDLSFYEISCSQDMKSALCISLTKSGSFCYWKGLSDLSECRSDKSWR